MEPFENENQEHTIYQDLSCNEVRYVQLSPASWSEPIRCNITNFSIDEAPAYVALSYAWGNPTDTVEIILNGRPFHVTTNLFDALRQLREFCRNPSEAPDVFQNQDLLFWIDALCINQANITEKSRQIPHIGSIYKSADQVVAWLGTNGESEDAVHEVMDLANKYTEMYDTAMEMADDLCHSVASAERKMTEAEIEEARDIIVKKAFDSAIKNALGGKDIELILEGFDNIYQRAWFRRVWVLQEVVLAQEPPLFFAGSLCCSVRGLWVMWFFLCGSDEYYHETRELSKYNGNRLEMYTELRNLTQGYRSALVDGLESQTSGSETSSNDTSTRRELGVESPNDFASEGKLSNQLCPTIKEILNDDEIGERTSTDLERFDSGLNLDPTSEDWMTGSLAAMLSRVLSEIPGTLKATVPHDYIYGIMSMIDPPKYPKALMPDYSLPYSEVYYRYARVILEHTGDLSFLPRRKNGLSGVPSWVPDFRAQRTDVGFDYTTLPFAPSSIRIIDYGLTCITKGVHLGRIVSTYYGLRTSWSPQQDVAISLRQYNDLVNVVVSIRSSQRDEVLMDCLKYWFKASGPIPVDRVIELYNCAIARIPLPGSNDERKYDAAILSRLESQLLDHSMFATSEGMLGRLTRFDTKANVGDVLAMMENTTDPFLLRPQQGGGYAFLGNCRSIGTYGKPDQTGIFSGSGTVEEFHLV